MIFRIDVGLFCHDFQNLRDRVKETETRLSQLEDDTAPTPERLVSLEKAANMWSKSAHDLKNRLRWNNLRILGLPEKAERKDPCNFVEIWMKESLPPFFYSPFYSKVKPIEFLIKFVHSSLLLRPLAITPSSGIPLRHI